LLFPEAEFLAVTGRRRVGKTHLVKTFFKENICFEMTGIQNGTDADQLVNFTVKLAEHTPDATPKIPDHWILAFAGLKKYLKTLPTDKKQVIFFDELPWMAAPNSNFIQFLAHFWNDYLSGCKHFILVVCGSATSWIVQKILGDVGGMHNRVTQRIHLEPFSIGQTQEFLQAHGHRLKQNEVAKIYMALGGIPFYLLKLEQGDNFTTGIQKLCFDKNGVLRREYENLYAALFKNPSRHESIVEALAGRPGGLTTMELMKSTKMTSSKTLNKALEELLLSDFIVQDAPFERKKRGTLYRLVDEFTIFHQRFVKPMKTYTPDYWTQQMGGQKFKIWCGFAFETLCRKHVGKIKDALRIGGVYAPVSTLRIPPSENKRGCQIDLILDRSDDTINLCEMKFHSEEFIISKDYHDKLLYKKHRFQEYSKTKKQVFLTMVTNHPVERNKWFLGTVDATVLLEDLFK